MRVIKSINHNAALCLDSAGHEVVALGTGVGFGELPREVGVEEVSRTFYDIDPRYLGLVQELPAEHLEFAAQCADVIRQQLSYELSPNFPITLADHLSFMLKRAQEHIVVSMPLSWDVGQRYPLELRLGELCVRGAQRTFGVMLPPSEATGVALSIINAALSPSRPQRRDGARAERIMEGVTGLVEVEMGVSIARDSFDYARFATHLRYLIDRMLSGEPIATLDTSLYEEVVRSYPAVAACADKVADYLALRLGTCLSDEERLYLMLHINRVVCRAHDAHDGA